MNMNRHKGTQAPVRLKNSKGGKLIVYYYFSVLYSVTPFPVSPKGEKLIYFPFCGTDKG